MGLFDRIKNSATSKINGIDNIELALQLFNSFGMGHEINPKYKKAVEKITSSLSRIDALKKAAELCEEDNSPKALYIKFNAYSWAGASCRKKTIEYGLKYLQGNVWEGISDDEINHDGFIQKRRTTHIAFVWLDLGKAYEGEQEFENALQSYRKTKELDPYFYGCDMIIANIYRKMNNLDMAISVLEKAKKNPLLKPRKYTINYGNGYSSDYTSPDYTTMFDKDLEDYKNKKIKGYVFKPKKRI